MKAIGLTAKPEIGRVAEKLELLEIRTPRPKGDEVMIKMSASAMHIDEIYAAQGTCLGRFFGPKNVSAVKPYILGSIASGVVVDYGDFVDRYDIGDEVIVIPDYKIEKGFWAEYQCVKNQRVVLKPLGLSHTTAVAAIQSGCVALSAINRAQVHKGDKCVVVGASGAIGLMMLQILKIRGCQVTAVCSGRNENLVRENGADAVIDYTESGFGKVLSNTNESQDLIFDCVGGIEVEEQAMLALRPEGKFVTLVGPQRYIGEERLDWWQMGKLALYVFWRMLFTLFTGPRYIFNSAIPASEVHEVLALFQNEKINAPLEKTIPFNLRCIADAVKLLVSHRARGRVVIDFSRKTK